ncbi:hypothetical protein ASE43_02305 [Lysobacter sp. Root983]|nr:hypothetical protein ASE43_02305 [Lysobacter sp. Root983]
MVNPSRELDAALAQVVDALGLVSAPAFVGHRVVHGGEAEQARVLDAAELERLGALSCFAPLHQRAALRLVSAVQNRWPGTRQYASFDTSWHAQLPANTRRLAVPKVWDALGIRRYGFHGLAFASAMRQVREADSRLGRERVVLAHLGSGCSLCAVRDSQSLDTTMTSTPLDGLPMATRSGSLDPGAVLHLLRAGGLSVDALEEALYHECGLRGVSGLSGDVRELLAESSIEAALALDIFALRIAQGIASMATRLGGIDHLIFSGGIGANVSRVRAAITNHLTWLGIGLDESANDRGDARIESPGSRARVWRVDVDEEAEIASACAVVTALMRS